MLKTTLGLAVGAVLLGACSHHVMHGDGKHAREGWHRPPPPKCRVGVYVTEGNVVVDHEPAHTRGCDAMEGLVWQVRTDGYRFDKDAIAFDKGKKPAADCKPLGEREYVCHIRQRGQGLFRYSIYLSGPGGPKLGDPSIMID